MQHPFPCILVRFWVMTDVGLVQSITYNIKSLPQPQCTLSPAVGKYCIKILSLITLPKFITWKLSRVFGQCIKVQHRVKQRQTLHCSSSSCMLFFSSSALPCIECTAHCLPLQCLHLIRNIVFLLHCSVFRSVTQHTNAVFSGSQESCSTLSSTSRRFF